MGSGWTETLGRRETLDRGLRTMHRGVGVEGARDALELAHHPLGRLRIGEHEIYRAHTLCIQTCNNADLLSESTVGSQVYKRNLK